VSVPPPGETLTTILIVLVVWDHALGPEKRMPEKAATTPAARCRNRRHGRFMTIPPATPKLSQLPCLWYGPRCLILARSVADRGAAFRSDRRWSGRAGPHRRL